MAKSSNGFKPTRNTNARPGKSSRGAIYIDRCGPDSDAQTMEFFAGYVAESTNPREDIRTWADVALELDDFVSFGGKA